MDLILLEELSLNERLTNRNRGQAFGAPNGT